MSLGIILLVFWIVLIPWMLGIVMNPPQDNIITVTAALEAYVTGIVFAFALFELIAVPFTFLNNRLTWVVVVWAGICLVTIAAGGSYLFIKRKQKFKFVFPKKNKMNLWWIGSLLLIVFQIAYVSIMMHIDDDDAWYVGTAVASYATDTMNKIYPYTGEVMNAFPSDYTLSPYPIFYAMLGKLTLLHPAILMHTVMPVILIGICYIVYYLIGGRLYSSNKKSIGCFMFYLALFHLFGNFSSRSVSTFLLFRIWQGKAALCNLYVPLAIYYFMKCIETNKRRDWIILCMCVIAGTMVSSMGVFLLPVLLGVMSIIVWLVNKNVRQMFYTALCIFPCIIQFSIFLLVLR